MGAEDDDQLIDWELADRTEVRRSNDPAIRRLLAAVEAKERLKVIYHGGTTPGQQRTIQPREMFTVSGYGGTYVRAYCETRLDERVFRVDRLEIPGIPRSRSYERRRSFAGPYSSPEGTGCLVSVAILLMQIVLLAVVLGVLLRWL